MLRKCRIAQSKFRSGSGRNWKSSSGSGRNSKTHSGTSLPMKTKKAGTNNFWYRAPLLVNILNKVNIKKPKCLNGDCRHTGTCTWKVVCGYHIYGNCYKKTQIRWLSMIQSGALSLKPLLLLEKNSQ